MLKLRCLIKSKQNVAWTDFVNFAHGLFTAELILYQEQMEQGH